MMINDSGLIVGGHPVYELIIPGFWTKLLLTFLYDDFL